MQPKRKAAANVFMEQNVAQQADMPAEPASPLSPAPAAPPPPGAAFGAPPPPQRRRDGKVPAPPDGLKTSEELQLEKEPVRVRETGVWPFKRIIVPPNVYVVHTRIGRSEPVTIGLGLSFRYNPNTDAYLIVPAAMQTIGIVANGISREKQGINILAYVQWQINDFSVAYRKLDFSDSRDPLGIVNAQLREQAEAAIKDKIATMSVEEVLTDKQPIIEELTARLKAVAEGRGGAQADDAGLGIKIVTVQLKEALVSSQRLWEHLQAPFRYDQEKAARISLLLAQDEIRQKELQNRQFAETGEAEALVEIERIKQTKQTEALDIRLAQEQTRFTREQETTRQKLQLEEQTTRARRESEQRLALEAASAEQATKLAMLRRAQEEAIEHSRLDAEASAQQKVQQVEQALQELAEETRLAESKLQAEQQRLDRETTLKRRESEFKLLTQEQETLFQGRAQEAILARNRAEALARLELEEASNRVKAALAEQEVAIERLRQEVRNLIGERELSSRLIEKLPELAAHMPEIHQLSVLQSGSGDGAFDGLALFLARMLALGETLGIRIGTNKEQAP
jgi:flotillin